MRKFDQSELKNFGDRTRLVLAGRDPVDSFGFVNPPIVRGSTVLYPSLEDFSIRKNRYPYGTYGNPTTDALEAAINAVEGGAGCMLCSSGLLACTFPLLATLKAGDHLLIVDSVYRPLRNFANGMMAKFGIDVSYYNPLIGGDIKSLFKPSTRAVWTEAPGSHTMEMQDIPAICAAAHAHGAFVIMDNTWATGIYFDAHGAGVDYSVQAGTKYFAGHSDVLIGSVSARTPEQYKTIKDGWHLLGSIIAPEDAFLTLRGLRTLHLRLPEHQKSALAMAQWFQARPEVARVMYPALPSDPGHALWKRDFKGASGLFSIELKPVSNNALAAFVDHLSLFGMGASWGGYESLVLPFECSPYRTATKPSFEGPTVRFHIGLENIADLQADLDRGFERMKKAG